MDNDKIQQDPSNITGKVWPVIIEWDGEKPPRTFYGRLHKLGLFVRGRKDEFPDSPLARRQAAKTRLDDPSIVVQEGCVILSSESLAKAVADYAICEGAKVVKIGMMESLDNYYMTTKDAEIMTRLESILGKRGRPSGDPVDWVATCHEEMKSYEVDNVRNVIACPHCGGVDIDARFGSLTAYTFPGGSLINAWVRHRFVNATFERPPEPPEGEKNLPPSVTLSTLEQKDRDAIEIMRNSAYFVTALAKMPRNVAATVCDGVFKALVYTDADRRRDERIKAVVELYERGVDPRKVSVIDKPDKVDILHAAEFYGYKEIAKLWIMVDKK
jgi:hypothetical protein